MEWVIIDLETTGLDPKRDKIIEIGAVLLRESGETAQFQTLVDPGMPLPRKITELTGISDDMLEGQPLIDEVAPDLLAFIGDAVPVAHNASFDGAFLADVIGVEKENWLDTIALAKMAFPMLESYALVNLVEFFDIDVSAHHRALADAMATAALFRLIRDAFDDADSGLIAAWYHILNAKHPVYGHFLETFGPDAFAETYLPPKAEKEGEGRRDLPDDDDAEKVIIDKAELDRYFDADDGLKAFVSDYRPRAAQKTMADAVCDAFNDDAYLLAEAGTGTGKTIAYLMPAVLLSLESHRPVLISTHTIHLQDQIMKKDIPELNTGFQGGIRSVLLKGRGHYLCLRKWEQTYQHIGDEDPFFLARLLPWVVETDDGDGDPLDLNGFERRHWQRFSAASENCLGPRCPYYHDRCFVRRARRQGEGAHLIVVNHSLLLTDAVMGGGILPQSEYLIIDEAHQLETVAESCLGGSFAFYDHTGSISEAMTLLQNLLHRVAMPGLYAKEESADARREKQDQIARLMDEIRAGNEKGKEAFTAVKEALAFQAEQTNMVYRSLRVNAALRQGSFWSDAEVALANLALWYGEIGRKLERIAAVFEMELEEDGNEKEKIRLAVLRSDWERHYGTIKAFLGGEEENTVAWLEEGGDRDLFPTLRTAPLRIDEAMAKSLFATKESVVFVSATLSVKDSFRYFRRTCGVDLAAKDVRELLLPSPFDYANRAVLVTSTDVPLVGSVSELTYLDSIATAVIDLTAAAKGRSLVLFTSHMHLREVFRRVEAPLRQQGLTVLAHEISGSRGTLLKKMREDKHTVLLGANSFWEGIDVAGENLSLLVIVRLPFWPPDIPTIAAKCDLLKAENRNAFSELSLPQAVIRFKQGFGRLLRKEEDRGVVCVLDKRIYEKRYGSDFVDSLPIDRLFHGTVEEIAAMIAKKL